MKQSKVGMLSSCVLPVLLCGVGAILSPRAYATTIIGGNNQSATVNSLYPELLRVNVWDSCIECVDGLVTFQADTSADFGAILRFSAACNCFIHFTTLSILSNHGEADVSFFAGTKAGPFNVTATAPAIVGGGTATFLLDNTPGPPASVLAISGTPQSTFVSTDFLLLLQAEVVDAFRNPTSALVRFIAPTVGPTGSFASGNMFSTPTASGGVATSSIFTAGSTPGTYNVFATVVGASPAAFNLTNVTPTSAVPEPKTLFLMLSLAGIVAKKSYQRERS